MGAFKKLSKWWREFIEDDFDYLPQKEVQPHEQIIGKMTPGEIGLYAVWQRTQQASILTSLIEGNNNNTAFFIENVVEVKGRLFSSIKQRLGITDETKKIGFRVGNLIVTHD